MDKVALKIPNAGRWRLVSVQYIRALNINRKLAAGFL